jgi:gas vesicle protein
LRLKNTCGITFVIFVIALAGTIWTEIAIDEYQAWQIKQEKTAVDKQLQEIQEAVMSFLDKMNPQLHKKWIEIKNEIGRIDHKIQQIVELKKDFPNHAILDEKRYQWQILKQQLNRVSQDIYEQVEHAYVAYRLDEIQGTEKLSVVSKTLLDEANAALKNAEITKLTIETEMNQ